MTKAATNMADLDEDDVFLNSTDEQQKHNDEPWYYIDVDMLSSKLSYFFQNAKDSCYLPYMILFLTGIGLTPDRAGKVNGLRFMGFIVGAPLWGILADYKKIHKLVISILCLASLFLISSQPFIGIPLTDKKVCDDKTNITGRRDFINTTESVDHHNNRVEGNTDNLYAALMSINLLASCFDGSTQGFVDSGVIQKVNTRKGEVEFGTQRLFGAIGYGVGAFASSLAIEYFPKSYLPCYTSVFIVYGCFMICLAVFTHALFNGLSFSSVSGEKGANRKIGKLNRSASVTSDVYRGENVGTLLRKTICDVHTLFFLSTVLIVGTIHAVYIGFLFVLLKEINCPNVVMGLSICVGSAASATCIRLSEKFIKLFGGTIRTLCFGTLSWGIRFLLFTYLQNPWIVLPIQILQGFGYGLFIATSLVHIRMISTPNIYTSMYGLFNGLFFGAGAVLGNVIGGSLLMKFGIRTLFLGTSIAGFAWTFIMLVYLVARVYIKKRDEKTNGIEEVELSQNA